MNKIVLNSVRVNIARVNAVGGTSSGGGGVIPPEPDITDALLMEDGSLFLMEDGSYFKLEETAQAKTINKSYWNF